MSGRFGTGRSLAARAAAAVLLATASALARGACPPAEIETMLAARKQQARQALEACVAADPRDARSAFLLGRSFYFDQDADPAARWLETASRIDGTSSEYQLWLGRAYGAQALRASLLHQAPLARKVRRCFERAVELDPGNLAARLSLVEYGLRAPAFLGGSLEKARVQAEEIRRRSPLEGHRAFGLIAEHEKRFDLAAQEYARAAEESRQSDPFYWSAELAESRKDSAAAFELYERLARDHSDTEALYQIGRLAGATGERLDRGEEALKLYLEKPPAADKPSPAQAHYRQGLIFERRKDLTSARRELALALDADPLLTEARRTLARLKK